MIKFTVDLGLGFIDLYINTAHITSAKITSETLIINTMNDEFVIPSNADGYDEALSILEALKLIMRQVSPIANIGDFSGIIRQ